jgi:hypothetical protein
MQTKYQWKYANVKLPQMYFKNVNQKFEKSCSSKLRLVKLASLFCTNKQT